MSKKVTKNSLHAEYSPELDVDIIRFKQVVPKQNLWPEVKFVQVCLRQDASVEAIAYSLRAFADKLLQCVREGELLP